MASLANDGGRKWRIQVGKDPDRKTIRFLGNEADARRFKDRVERLEQAQMTAEEPDLKIIQWLDRLPDKLHDRIVRAGLAKERNQAIATLDGFLAALFATFDIKPSTLHNYTMAADRLKQYFGADKPLREIAATDAQRYQLWLRDEAKLAEATRSKWLIIARQFFKQAVKRGVIRDNPFAELKPGKQSNRARMYFVSRSDAQKLIDAATSVEWKLMIALSRYGGLRCPSEILALKWTHVDFEHDRLRVPSSKTERYEGGDERVMPIFPELRPLLLDAFEQADEGAKYVIARYRENRTNLRTQLCRFIRRAGLVVWPKPWHNMRSTRQSELTEDFPAHVVCAWLGNSVAVARDHYLQVRDEHFKKAAQKAAQTPVASESQRGTSASENAICRSQATVDPVRQVLRRSRQESNL